jgi:hypothetical protein
VLHFPAPASAATITLSFTGFIFSVPVELVSAFSTGERVSGSFRRPAQ